MSMCYVYWAILYVIILLYGSLVPYFES